jgi:lantibiotic modifying enzyme
MLDDGDDPQMWSEIDAAVTTTLAQGFGHNHSLCHGDLGNVDLLLAAPRPEALRDDIARVTAMIAASIRDHGWITGVPFGVESPGLMTGLAGTGYGLLRLFAPSAVPSVLLLEPPAGS